MTAPPVQDKDYLLGTHDEEIARLGLQHRVWRPRALMVTPAVPEIIALRR